MNILEKMLLVSCVILLSSTIALAGDVMTLPSGNIMGNTGMNPRSDINVNANPGAVGQMDWRVFNSNNSNTNFGFNGLSQTSINQITGGHVNEIMSKIRPDNTGTNTVMTNVPAQEINPSVNFEFSPSPQANIPRVTGLDMSKIQDRINKPDNVYSTVEIVVSDK